MTSRTRAAIAMVGVLLAHAAGAQFAGAQATLTVDGRSSANPSLAVDGQFVAVAFSAATINSMDVFVATSRDGGRTFAAPTQVNAVAGEARVSGEEPPRVALVPRTGQPPEIVVVWTAKDGNNWKLLTARSTDAGRSFGASKVVAGSDGEGSRGWQSVAVDARGNVLVLWLDHRDLVAADAAHKHTPASGAASATTPPAPMPKADPTERAGLSQLLFTSLSGTGAVKVTRSVCYCCKTSLVTSGGNVYAVWRHVYAGSQRDMAFAMSADGGRTFTAPVRVSEDHWQLDGCPDNGPALAIDRGRRAHVVWPAPADGRTASALSLFYAVSRDGRSFGPRVRIPSRGPASHGQVVIANDGTALVAWDEIVDGARRLGMARARVDASGSVTFSTVQPPDGGAGNWYPAVAATSSGTVVAWVKQVEKGTVVSVGTVNAAGR